MVKYCVFGFVCMWVRGCVGSWVVGMWVCWSVCVLVGGYIEVIPSYSVCVDLVVGYVGI